MTWERKMGVFGELCVFLVIIIIMIIKYNKDAIKLIFP
jgi:hypothetical protein